jgi:cell division septal protein FtsQ
MERLRPIFGFLWILASAALAVALYAGVRAGSGWSPFVLQAIRVEGATRHTPDEVLRAAGLQTGLGLFQIDVSSVRRQVEGLPWVRRARVLRQIPSTLIVTVEEWEPGYLVRLDRLYYLTPEAHVVQAPLDQGLDFPVVTGLGWADLEGEGPLRTALVQLLALLDAGALPDEVSEIHVDSEEGFTVYTAENGGSGIRLGRNDLEEKFQRLGRLRRHLARRGQSAYCVNLADEDKIVARLLPTEGKGARP